MTGMRPAAAVVIPGTAFQSPRLSLCVTVITRCMLRRGPANAGHRAGASKSGSTSTEYERTIVIRKYVLFGWLRAAPTEPQMD
jgi:hypothetical protein